MLQDRMREALGVQKWAFTPKLPPAGLDKRMREVALAGIKEACSIREKHARYDRFGAVKKSVVETLAKEFPEQEAFIKEAYEDLRYDTMREQVVHEGARVDGRDHVTVRPINIEVGFLPRTHGSTLFTRGETQAICTTTLGTSRDQQKIDGLMDEEWKRFLLHYNFPPFSVGEVRPLRGPGRREIGHGHLAERALARMLPSMEEFPYTIRLVSEITESNGSSSMATVCGGALAMMDAGIKIKSPVAGVAMGLIHLGEKYAVLTDILGDEDHLGDMDFKVCGTEQGHHRDPDGHQDPGPDARGRGEGAGAGQAGAPARARRRCTRRWPSRAPSCRRTRRASPRSRSSPTRSARSSAQAAR